MILNLTVEVSADGYESELDELAAILTVLDDLNDTAISLTILDHVVVNISATYERIKATAPNLYKILESFYYDTGGSERHLQLRMFQNLHTVPTTTLLDVEHFLKDTMSRHDLETLQDAYDDSILDNYDDLDNVIELQNIIDRFE